MTPAEAGRAPLAAVESRIAPSLARRLATTCIGLSTLMVLLSIVGIVRAYSPVPYWDMWDGYVGFFLRASSEGWSALFEAHNEHRLILARLLFYPDIAWFGGMGILPLVANVALAGGVAFSLCRAALTLTTEGSPPTRHAIVALIVGMAFFWSQRENFTWAFQTQFFLAEALPLFAFQLAASGASAKRAGNLPAMGTACAFLAIGAMANGILVFPLLLFLGACIGLGRRWLFGTGLITIATIALFLRAFRGGQTHVPMLLVLQDRPFEVLHFVLRYLGSPLYFALGAAPPAIPSAEVSGAVLLVGACWLVPAAWRERRSRPLRIAMLAVVSYVVASALGTALGRLPIQYGLAGALVSRYSSLAMLAWLALVVAASPGLAAGLSRARVPALICAVLLAMLPWQLRAARSQASITWNRELAGLALATGTNDPEAISAVYPREATDIALDTATRARAAGLPPFGRPVFASASGWLGSKLAQPVCQGGIETSRPLSDEGDQRIDGHLRQAFSQSAGQPALVVDGRDTIVGWVLVAPRGARRRDDAAQGEPFSGYVRHAQGRESGLPATSLRICQLPTSAPFV
ncbi:hypothetical protein SAMN02800694_0706 [Luteibacter sp. UNCMF331Sha3.1]|uniref:hypothetical protein n=1 Tax=Luteibacter sp. UNCMF331Sha3.1 TaxID=1502760 RepID=UPI0008B2AA19|nr:hypothetical protein [Luteibacter sp. UNCMF331Sha3.1]SEM34031.1 hypothetical protein SAMN02800694_0706 [Luteibacter sp. UNCMF331Sha3.1]